MTRSLVSVVHLLGNVIKQCLRHKHCQWSHADYACHVKVIKLARQIIGYYLSLSKASTKLVKAMVEKHNKKHT